MTLDERIAKERKKVKRFTREVQEGKRIGRNLKRLTKARAMLAVLEEVKLLPGM